MSVVQRFVVKAKHASVLLFTVGACATAPPSGQLRDPGATPAPGTRACSPDGELAEERGGPKMANPLVVEADYRVTPSRQISPCVFAGTLSADLPVYSAEDAATPFARLQFVEVAAFKVPQKEGARAQVEIAWPVRALVWMSAESLPLELAQRIDIVSDRYWLAPGARVAAWQGSHPGQAVVYRPYAAKASELRDPALSPGAYRGEQPCSMLSLTARTLIGRSTDPNSALGVGGVKRWLEVPRPSALSAIPGGPAVGSIPARCCVALRDERGAWVRVQGFDSLGLPGELGVDFEGWVPVSATQSGVPLAFAFGPISLPPTHRSTTDVALRSVSTPSGPVVATLLKGLPFRAVRRENSHVQVRVPGLQSDSLWISEEDLCASGHVVRLAARPLNSALH